MTGEFRCQQCGGKSLVVGMCSGCADGEIVPARIHHPAHYGGDTTYEVVKVAEAWGLDEDAYLFNVLKYVARAGKKLGADRIEDMEKAHWYLDRRIVREKAKL